MVKSLEDQVAAAPTPTLSAEPEIRMALKRPTHGNYQNQFRGATKGRQVVARVYMGHDDAAAHAGDVIVVKTADAIGNGDYEEVDGRTEPLYRFEWRSVLMEGDFIQVWAPKKAAVTGFKLTL